MYELVIVYVYLFLGFYLIYDIGCIDKNYLILMLFFLIKSLINYRKCTVSFLEIYLRNVKKERGYLYRFMDDILDIRNTKHIYFIYLLCFIQIYYFFFICEDTIKIF